MDKTAAFLPGDLNLLARETDMLATTVASLAADELPQPARREGRTRADVLAQIVGAAHRAAAFMESAHTGDGPTGSDSSGGSGASGAGERGTETDAESAGLPAPQLKARVADALDRVTRSARELTTGVARERLDGPGGALDAYWLPALWTTQAILLHDDLDTVWELEEADITALEDAMEVIVARLAASPDSPLDARLLTAEGEEYTLGAGAPDVRGERYALLSWLTGGEAAGVHAGGALPASPRLLDLI